MYLKKYLFFVILFLSCLSLSAMTESEFNNYKSTISNECDKVHYQTDLIRSMLVSLDNYATSNLSASQADTIHSKTSDINLRANLIDTYANNIATTVSYLQYDFSGGSSGGGCNWSTNDVFSLLSDTASLVSYFQELNDVVFDDPNSIQDVFNSFYDTIASPSNDDSLYNWVLEMAENLYDIYANTSNLKIRLNEFKTYLSNLDSSTSSIISTLNTISSTLSFLNSDASTIVQYTGSIIDFLGVITYDVGNISTNTSYIVQQLNGLTNRFYYSSRMGYDRFRYFGKPMAGAEIQLTNLAPYDSLNNLQNATIYDIISSGFSSSLIAFGSINNYLHFLERAVVSNNDSRIVAHLGAISNLVHRVDDYVLNDFSNEFHTLAVEIDSWYQGGVSNQNQIAISNQFYLSVITQQIDSVSALLLTNNFLISELSIITNEVGQISTNVSWLVDNIRSLELPVTAEFRGDQDTYYDFLTNYYLSGTANDNPSSNWFERVEVLLAALVFSGNSTTNISDTLSDSSSLSQQVETLIDTIDFSQDSSNTISLSRNVQQSYINFFHSLRNTISSKSNTSTFVLGWGDKDTVTFNDLTSGNFRISISTTEGVFGTFTNIFRSVTTMVWVLFTLFCIYKMGFWLCSRIYSLYSIVRSLIFSLWGK